MNKKQFSEIIKAIMVTAGLDPHFDDDYYGGIDASNIATFCNGACGYFDLPNDTWHFHFNNLEFLDSPSETLAFFESNRADFLTVE